MRFPKLFARALLPLLPLVSLVAGCPKKEPQDPGPLLSVKIQLVIVDKSSPSDVRVADLKAGASYYLDAVSEQESYVRAFGYNSGGGPSAVSDLVRLEPGKRTRLTYKGQPFTLETWSKANPAVPGGPLHVLALSSKESAERFATYLEQRADWTVIKRDGTTIEREL